MPDKPITVLLINDHPIALSGYRRLIEGTADILLVADVDNVKAGCILYESHHPDVLIVDLNMPNIDEIKVIRRIKTKCPAAKILVFGMHCNKIMVQRVLEIGATGFLTRQSCGSQLIDAIRQVNKGQLYIDLILIQTILSGDVIDDNHTPLMALSAREFQIFKLFAEGNSFAQIAETISISPKTVGVYHANTMMKLKLQNTAQLVRMAIEHNVIQP